MAVIESNMQHRKDDFEVIHKAALQLENIFQENQLNLLDWGVCHGDLHGNTNVSFTDEFMPEKFSHYRRY